MSTGMKRRTGLSIGVPAPPPRHGNSELPRDPCWVPLNADALHDLVGPANQMRSMLELLLKRHRPELDGDAQELFGFLQASLERLQNLLSGLRTYSQIVEGRAPYCHFDANAIFAGALATIQQTMDRSGALVTHDRLPELYGDPSQICCVFASLIENSIKFRSERTPEIYVTSTPEEDNWLFSVSDNGIGIDPRHCDRIFGVFKRVHNDTYPGAGMGLAIANRIIGLHGGRIWAESHLGEGATFFFTLPKTTGSAAHPLRGTAGGVGG